MDVQALFGISILVNFLASAIVAKIFISPHLNSPRALITLVAPNMFRFVGLSFLVPGVVSSTLPSAFARPAAYGDLLAAGLAVVSVLSLYGNTFWAVAVVWVFNVWGTADLLNAFYQGQIGVGIEPGSLGAAFFIPTVVVPPLLVTHAMIFWVLLRGSGRAEGLGEVK